MDKDNKYRIKLADLNSTETYINIPLSTNFQPVGNDELILNQFVPEELEAATNPILDFEKIRIPPYNNINEIVIKLMNNTTTPMTYSEFGFDNEDVIFRKNRFINSFLKLDFFDSNIPTNQRRAFQIDLFSQLNDDQRDGNGKLLDVSLMPVTYRIVNPIKRFIGNYEGFFLYWFKNLDIYSYPQKLYAYTSFNNALDGNITQLLSFESAININDFFNKNYLKYTINNSKTFQIDDSDRRVFYPLSSGRLEIELYRTNFV